MVTPCNRMLKYNIIFYCSCLVPHSFVLWFALLPVMNPLEILYKLTLSLFCPLGCLQPTRKCTNCVQASLHNICIYTVFHTPLSNSYVSRVNPHFLCITIKRMSPFTALTAHHIPWTLISCLHFLNRFPDDQVIITASNTLLKNYCLKLVRFEVFTAMTINNAVFWNVAPCRYFVNRRFGGTYRLHLQGRRNPRAINQRGQVAVPPKRRLTKYLHDATSQKTAFFMFKTSLLYRWTPNMYTRCDLQNICLNNLFVIQISYTDKGVAATHVAVEETLKVPTIS
jgi:hypothetical protein